MLILKDGPHRRALQPRGGAPRQPQVRRARDAWARAPSFTGAVEGLGCECAFYPNGQGIARVKLVLPETIAMRELFRLAAEHDVQIRRLNYRRDSLEDIFLAAMKEKRRRAVAVYKRTYRPYDGPAHARALALPGRARATRSRSCSSRGC